MPVTRRSPRGAAKRPAETEAEPEKAQRPRVEEANVPAAAAAAPSTSPPDVPAPESAPSPPAEAQARADAPSARPESVSAPAPAPAPSGAADAGAGAGGGTAMIRGLPKTWDERDFRKWLDTLTVARSSCKKKKQWPYGFITFGFLEDRLHATKTLEGCVLGGRRITTHEALSKKPRDKSSDKSSVDARGRTREELIVAAADRGARRDVRDAVCPLWATPYADQLATKRAKVEEALRNLTRHTAKNCRRLKKQGAGGTWRWPAWLGESNRRGKLAAPVEGIVRSPVLEGYRNKSEFTIGPDADGVPTVGFNVGLFKEGVTAVASADKCRHISPTAKRLAAAAQAFLREDAANGGLPVWDKRRGTGFWRLLGGRGGGMAPETGAWAAWKRSGVPAERDAGKGDALENAVEKAEPAEPAERDPAERDPARSRETTMSPDDEASSLPYPRADPNAEVMVLVQVSPAGHDPAKARDACARLAAALATAAAQTPGAFPLTRSLAQTHDGCANAAPADSVLCDLATGARVTASEYTIHEELCGLRFTLSASAFFQVNTCAAEALYRLAGEWASPTGKSLLLDVCCGTGTIGLTLAARARKVVGVDIVEAAIEDAEKNAALNGVTNCEWVAGRAELKLPEILNKYAPEIKPAPPIAMPQVAPAAADAEESGGEEDEVSAEPDAAQIAQTAQTTQTADGDDRAPVAAAPSSADAEPNVSREYSYEYDDVVAVVDPPRAGLHKNVLHALRAETRLRRLVYVSCNPESMASNCADLCTPQGPRGDSGGAPFRPVRAMAVDLFPHTPHCEAVLLLER